jgi:hypothetical protein
MIHIVNVEVPPNIVPAYPHTNPYNIPQINNEKLLAIQNVAIKPHDPQ